MLSSSRPRDDAAFTLEHQRLAVVQATGATTVQEAHHALPSTDLSPDSGEETGKTVGGRQGRGIPMVRPATNPNQQRGVLASSLDLVFSYSRSQAFYGENLPSSPSFVAGYHRMGDEEEPDSSVAGTEEEDVFSDDEVEEGYDEDGLEGLGLADDDPDQDEADGWGEAGPLPPNATSRLGTATRKQRRTSNRQLRQAGQRLRYADNQASSTAGRISTPLHPSQPTFKVPYQDGAVAHSEVAKAGERTSLLRKQPSRSSHASSVAPRWSGKLLDDTTEPYASPRTGPAVAGPDNPPFASSSGLSIRLVGGGGPIPPGGASTFGQTLFNSFNALCGVAILSEPLAFASAGWLGGSALLLFSGLVTNYTAKILAKMLIEDRTLLTYNDIGMKAFGPSFRWLISFLFCLELLALSIALVVLFGDSFSTLFPTWSATSFKLLGFFIILPTVFLPYRLLSYTSLIGLLSSLTLVAVILLDGMIKEEQPGSLGHPMETSLGPGRKWGLSAGLFMSGFAGHAVMPSLARDMQRPQDFYRMINIAYIFAGLMYAVIGIAGYLMFGGAVTDEVTRDILQTQGYPEAVNTVAVWMVGMNPIAKFALGTRPLNTMIEHFLGIGVQYGPPPARRPSDARRSSRSSYGSGSGSARPSGLFGAPTATSPPTLKKAGVRRNSSAFSGAVSAASSSLNREIRNASLRVVSRVTFTAVVVLIAVALPDFDRVMSFLGSFSAFVICIIVPILAYLRVFKDKLSRTELTVDYALLAVSVIMASAGTLMTFVPITDNE